MSEHEQHPWQRRLDAFLEQHHDQVSDADARLVFSHRLEDTAEDISSYIRQKEIKSQVQLRPGKGNSKENNILSEHAMDAILTRAKKIFTHNQNPPHLRRGYDIRSIHLREGDRLAIVPGTTQRLEDVLFNLAEEMKSIYCVSGNYGGIEEGPQSKLLNYVRREFNGYGYRLPFPLVEAAFKGKEFSYELIYDGVLADKSVEKMKVSQGDPLLIFAFTREENLGGYEPYAESDFKIAHHSNMLPLVVTQADAILSPNNPIICTRHKENQEERRPDSRYEIRISPHGKLYVANYAIYNGKTWSSVGSWDNSTENVPGDYIEYQILKAVPQTEQFSTL